MYKRQSEQYPLNLMVFAGLPEREWQKYVYIDVSDINNPDKALACWARS